VEENQYNSSKREPQDLLIHALGKKNYLQQPAKRNITLLLDTDREIGKETGTPETRVGIIPSQADQLRRALMELGLLPTVYVVKGAGELAAFPDSDYAQVGCLLLDRTALSFLPDSPDVVHALKEPSAHEGDIPGAFIRIGASHLTNFTSKDGTSGLAHLLRARNFSCILD
jgi:hypothetical protein